MKPALKILPHRFQSLYSHKLSKSEDVFLEPVFLNSY